ncbi:hypothetical protein C8R44DRAFT_658323 [Mycena epipterygia]|nr:hypothetical protein C8R44DRAFT_658323 [Mycena epipterygia]
MPKDPSTAAVLEPAESSAKESAPVAERVQPKSVIPQRLADMTSEDDLKALLATVGVLRERLEGCSVTFMKRLYMVCTYVNAQRSVYAVEKVPIESVWGKPKTFDDPSNFVCDKDTGVPHQVWLTGEVAVPWFFDNEGFPAKRAGLSLQAMSQTTHEFCKNQLNSLCMPKNSSSVAEGLGPDQIRATCWMTRRGVKGQPSTTEEFTDFYDARESLQDKTLMSKLSIESLKVHDIVMIEARIARYAVNTAETGDRKGKKAMTRWQTFYDMKSVYLLRSAPDHPVQAATVVSDFAI